MIQHKKITIALLVSAFVAEHAGNVSAAPALPDIQPNIPRPQIPESRPVPVIPLEQPVDSIKTKKSAIKIVVKSFTFSGNKQFKSDELAGLLDNYLGREIGMRELNESIGIVRNYYRNHGFLLAQVYLPTQDLQKSGDSGATVELAILEGTLGTVKIEAGERVSASYMQKLAEFGLHEGEVLNERNLVRNLMILNGLPGVTATSQLNPGEAVGSSDVVVAVEPKPMFNGYVNTNTYGNRFTGREVVGFGLAINNPAGRGDQLAFIGKVSNGEGQRAFGAYYVFPVCEAGTQLNLGYNYVDYKLGRELKSADARGDANYFTAAIEHPWIRDTKTGVTFRLGGNYKLLDDKVGLVDLDNKRNITSMDIGVVGDWINASGSTVYQWGAILTHGVVNFKNSFAETLDQSSNDTQGGFTKWNLTGTRTQYFDNGVNWIARLDYQGAHKNLDIAEKFGIGANNRWRSFAELPSQADEGWMLGNDVKRTFNLNNEAGTRWVQSVTPFAFYDIGRGKLNHDPLGSNNHIRSTHIGVGADLQLTGQWVLSATLSEQKRDADGASADTESRLWGQLKKTF